MQCLHIILYKLGKKIDLLVYQQGGEQIRHKHEHK